MTKQRRISKPLHDAGVILQNPNSTKKDKEIAAVALAERKNYLQATSKKKNKV